MAFDMLYLYVVGLFNVTGKPINGRTFSSVNNLKDFLFLLHELNVQL